MQAAALELADDGSLRITHEVTSGNEIETAWVNDGTLVTQPYVYDGAGNLVFDGELFYQYDGFNRLVQVNAGTDLDPNDFSISTGRLVDPNTAPVGVRLATFTYDGLGRLIRTVRQDPNDAAEAEDYYYDGPDGTDCAAVAVQHGSGAVARGEAGRCTCASLVPLFRRAVAPPASPRPIDSGRPATSVPRTSSRASAAECLR